MSLTNLCNKRTATLSRPTITADALGGQTRTFATVSTFRCTIQPARGKVVEEFAKRSMIVTHRAYTTTAVSVQTGDRLVSDGVNYLIHGWGKSADDGRLYHIDLERKD